MSNKETNLKEKFRIALSSTAKVIADDIDINNKSFEDKKTKDISSFEINSLLSFKASSIFNMISLVEVTSLTI